MKCPSDAQAKLLALVAAQHGSDIEWRRGVDYGKGKKAEYFAGSEYKPSRARLYIERTDREANMSHFEPADEGRYEHRVATVEACLRAGWLDDLHRRTVSFAETEWGKPPSTWMMHQLDLTEDGVIALGLWRERKLNSGPVEIPALTERERQVLVLAQMALDIGYVLCAGPKGPARLECRRMRKAGLIGDCWVANSASGIVPRAIALVEIAPDRADVAA